MSADAPRVFAILGAGAVGSSLAALLLQAGHEVVVVARRVEDALQTTRVSEVRGRDLAVRDLVVQEWVVRDLGGLPREPAAVFVCTRGEQIRAALAELAGKVEPACPIVVPGVTFDDLDELAHAAGIPNPMFRLAVGFGVSEEEPRHYHLFPLSRFGSVIAPESSGPAAVGRELAQLLSLAGLPTRALRPALFHPFLFVFNALQVPFLLAWGRAAWDLERLRRAAPLVATCAAAMYEVSRALRAGTGPLGWLVGLLPRAFFSLLVRLAARLVDERLRRLFLRHGPKIAPQLRFNAEQLIALGARRGKESWALRALAGIENAPESIGSGLPGAEP